MRRVWTGFVNVSGLEFTDVVVADFVLVDN